MKQSKVKTLKFNQESLTDEGVISGVLNHFGNEDWAGDVTLKGAFAKSIKAIEAEGRHLVMLWQHDHEKPIGVWKNLRETDRGLEGDGYINLETTLGREAYALAKQGALSGISIGYWVVEEHYDKSKGINYLHEVSLLETSLVTFPCNEMSRIDEVKKMQFKEQPTKEELKSFLESTGLDSDAVGRIVSKYIPEHMTDEELEAKRVEMIENAKGVVMNTASELNMTVKDLVAAIEGVDETRTTDDLVEQKSDEEDEDEDEVEEKANDMDSFFTK